MNAARAQTREARVDDRSRAHWQHVRHQLRMRRLHGPNLRALVPQDWLRPRRRAPGYLCVELRRAVRPSVVESGIVEASLQCQF